MAIHLASDAGVSDYEINTSDVERALNLVLEGERRDSEPTIDVVLGSDDLLARLNETYRGKAGSTDVLSFPLMDGVKAPNDLLLGEIYISLQMASEQARDTDTSLEVELARLVIHGALHLFGYDHVSDEDAQIMEPLGDRYHTAWRNGAP
ncbi:MAG: rRNA maturation RNase YbeY [Gemmatimonadetes bacterium]|nr:rRNA maturation RNase YbeY [Gemmatimonadota bacterium]